MAVRGSASRRTLGNPLGGVLKDLDRRARSIENRPRDKPRDGPPGRPGAPGPPGRSPAAAVVVTGHDGRARWVFTTPMPQVPVIGAVAVCDQPAVVTVEEVTAREVTVRVWHLSPAGPALCPAGPGVQVHLTATPPAATTG